MSSYRNIDGRIVAKLENGTLFKKVAKSKHMFKQNQGWGFDEEIINQASKDGAVRVKVFDIETGTIYAAPIDTFLLKAQVVDYGHGTQLILGGRYWSAAAAEQGSFEF